ncbi:MAG TPA: hypothetical protein VF133_21435 [Terriglobales bacterium]
MHFNLLALYAGPDQVMTVTSGIASVVGVLLIFWHKLVAAFSKMINKLRGIPDAPAPAPENNTPPQGS